MVLELSSLFLPLMILGWWCSAKAKERHTWG